MLGRCSTNTTECASELNDRALHLPQPGSAGRLEPALAPEVREGLPVAAQIAKSSIVCVSYRSQARSH